MDESRYRELAADALRRVVDVFDDLDPDVADVDTSADVVTITLRGGAAGKIVVNTQGAVRQIWLAGRGRGWHFAYDEASGRWLDDRGTGEELFTVLRGLVRDAIGVDPSRGA
ncbi:MAG: iron donor protein CyaY [Myxococcota bacterium]|nr:iron donor protein CyaY [Myxococcota bacterium]MDW8362884.1 iron donor protein CyaY [Myxococcales bacterium]